jgi:hypothetical protein
MGPLLDLAVNDQVCFRVLYFNSLDPTWIEEAQLSGPSLNRISAMGYLEYRDFEGNVTRIPLPTVGILQLRRTRECIIKVPEVAKLVKPPIS